MTRRPSMLQSTCRVYLADGETEAQQESHEDKDSWAFRLVTQLWHEGAGPPRPTPPLWACRACISLSVAWPPPGLRLVDEALQPEKGLSCRTSGAGEGLLLPEEPQNHGRLVEAGFCYGRQGQTAGVHGPPAAPVHSRE